MIYLDYSATTPVNKEVLDIFNKVSLDYVGNSNSLHSLGIKSKNLEEYLTDKIAKLLKVKSSEIIYTSSASESNNMAIKGIAYKYKNRGKHIITTPLEHSSIIAPLNFLIEEGYEVDYAPLKEDGTVDISALKNLIRDDTILVSICAVDSELGIRQPINEIGKMLKDYPKCIFHSDFTQAVGKIETDFTNVDIASISAHKIYGLKGIGLLIKKENISLTPLIHGGKSTTIYRSGTPCLALIASIMKALEIIIPKVKDNYNYVDNLSKKVKEKLSSYDLVHINSTDKSIPFMINFSLNKIKSETFIHALDEKEIYISTKSACSTPGSISNSVYAVTKNNNYAMSSLRISLSYLTTEEEVNIFLKEFDNAYRRLNLK